HLGHDLRPWMAPARGGSRALGWLSRGNRRVSGLGTGLAYELERRRADSVRTGRSPRGPAAPMNIVNVDDQTPARTMRRRVLADIIPALGVLHFGSPQQALRWCEESRPDLLLLDYRMPVIDGLEFARRFRKPLLHRDVPIVLVTVVGDEPIRQAALDAGVIDF